MIKKVVVSPHLAVVYDFSFDISSEQQEKIDDYLVRRNWQGLRSDTNYTLWIDRDVRKYEGKPICIGVCGRAADELFDGCDVVRFHIVWFKEWEEGD